MKTSIWTGRVPAGGIEDRGPNRGHEYLDPFR